MDAFEKEWSEYASALDGVAEKVLAQTFFRAGMRAAAGLCRKEAAEWTALRDIAIARKELHFHETASILSANRCATAILAEADK
jgi:hypothetical protein